MNRTHFLSWLLLFAFVLSGCSIELDSPVIATPDVDVFVPTLDVSPVNSAPSAVTRIIPVTWSGLNLTGNLVYISPPVTGDVSYFIHIQKLNLLTGAITTVFSTIGDDWIFYLGIAPDARQLVMSYMPSARIIYTAPRWNGSTAGTVFTANT
jgi:hypothetical protein